SGITTSVLGALKRGLKPLASELGLHVCGGRGKHSRLTPGELVAAGDRTGFDGAALAQASRLVAKVDSAAVQDGYDLCLQGFVDAPHAAVEGRGEGEIVNLVDARAGASRDGQLALLQDWGPDRITAELGRIEGRVPASTGTWLPHLDLPDHHDVRAGDVVLRRLHGNLAVAAEQGPKDFQDLLLVPGVGARTVKALALLAEVVHGAPCRFSDPARFSIAHGGKDRHPFPVPTGVYDKTITILKTAVHQARLG